MRQPQQEEYTVMFADVVDSTGLYERLGDIEAQYTISQCIGLVRDLVQRNKGRVIKTAGDDVLCMFDRAEDAILSAVSIQEAMREEMTFDGYRISMHIGVHSGIGLITEGDVFGDLVNVAARVTAAAKAEQILTTSEVRERLPKDIEGSVPIRQIDKISVKGRHQPVELHEVLWRGDLNLTEVLVKGAGGLGSTADKIRAGEKILVLRNCGVEFDLTSESKPFIIGRDLEANLTINGSMVSRQHAVIEYRRDKFVLRDQSTNGTYIRPNQAKAYYVKREETPLVGEGEISLGKTVDDRPALNIYYNCP